ncbi:sulfatase-like hydrolase/transferase [Luteolibacter sp. AS25]|uniref:sulfatase-like hydrolase/transferase n=1 Tax=Luteolibacter sp. AS25 TaxID=3135776 RepID=UPI00398AB9C5
MTRLLSLLLALPILTVQSRGAAEKNNILLLIVDDWGIDSSPLDSSPELNPETTYPSMPNLEALAKRGIRFTNAYAQPVCSPTRATILTGRYAFRHGVGAPETQLPTDEIALPKLFTAAASNYQMASFGKWHLGGTQNGPAELGGWPNFSGILRGGVPDYFSWRKTENGNSGQSSTYTTTDQVNDAVRFISSRDSEPWFAWVAFNAPHTPFHNPPENLHSYRGLSTDQRGEISRNDSRKAYEAALEALDTEIGRLLESVDTTKTNIFLIGDNGTPAQVVQPPLSRRNAKGSLFQGGIHVPFIVAGPDVSKPGTSDELVHCADLFSTILELAEIDPAPLLSPNTIIDSKSLLPIFRGQEFDSRFIVSEQFETGRDRDGRAIISSKFPAYKLIVPGNPTKPTKDPIYEIYRISTQPDKETKIVTPTSSADPHFAAYKHLIAIDETLSSGSQKLGSE